MTDDKAGSEQPQGSIMDGIDVSERKPIDSNWSKRTKKIVGSVAALLAVGAVTAGAWVMIASRPPGLPKTAEEAVAVMSSDAFDRLDGDRKKQYIAQARKLLADLPEEERRQLVREDMRREARWEMRSQMMDDFAYSLARGERPDMPMRRPRNNDGDGERRERPDPSDIPPEVRDRIADAIMTSIQSGNAQANALRGEMFQRRMMRRNRQNENDG